MNKNSAELLNRNKVDDSIRQNMEVKYQVEHEKVVKWLE